MRASLWCLGFLALGPVAGCDHFEDCCGSDGRAPYEPQGLVSRTGDEQVELSWYSNTEGDLAGYRVWRSRSGRDFRPIATLSAHALDYVDRGLENGVRVHYALTAFDRSGNESDLTPEDVFDTPRPEGFDLRLRNLRVHAEDAGYDFSAADVVDGRSLAADVYFWASAEDGPWMVATTRSADVYTDIQDAGHGPLGHVDSAPAEGWAPDGEVPLIEGHSYVVWTWDDHYAKFRVTAVDAHRVLIDWAYQPDRGNPELGVPRRTGGGVPRSAPSRGLSEPADDLAGAAR